VVQGNDGVGQIDRARSTSTAVRPGLVTRATASIDVIDRNLIDRSDQQAGDQPESVRPRHQYLDRSLRGHEILGAPQSGGTSARDRGMRWDHESGRADE